MASEQFSLCWDNFHKNMSSGMNSLLESEDLVDVTLAVEGKYLKAHKMVLSVCSPYFRELFKVNPCKHPIVFLKDVSYVAMSDLLQFMYQGEVQVSQENLTTFIKTAEALQIKGLTGDGNGTSEGDADLLEDHQQPFKADTTTPKPALTPSSTRQKRTQHSQIITPSNVKKPRVSSPPITSKQTLLTSKSEVATPASSSVSGSITPATELIQFKMEPSENVHGHSTITSEDVEQDFDDTLDDTGDETNEEYAMMEGGDEEPQAGTSAEGTAAAGEGQEVVLSDIETDPEDNFLASLCGIKSEELEEVAQVPEEINLILPSKSSQVYQSRYNKFLEWCKEKDVTEYTEDVVLGYFSDMKTKCNMKSSSLWAWYSMLKLLLNMRNGIDISNFPRLKAFLKQESQGYTPTKSRALTKDEFEQFLLEASDEKYLAMKVVMIIGISGGCRREELINLKVEDIEDLGSLIHIKIPDSTTKRVRSFKITGADYIHYYRKYASLRPQEVETNRFFLQYLHGKCTRQAMGINKIGSIPKMIANYLKLPNWKEYTGHCFRKTSSAFLESEKRQRNVWGSF